VNKDDFFFVEVLIFEALTVGIMLVLALRYPSLGATWCRKVSRVINRIAMRQMTSVLLVGIIAVAGSIAVSLLIHLPQPRIHDEFSYLLAADTFASGRLSNPPHPMWPHFETAHIIQQPTYASKHPPAQGLLLAIGQMMGGHPIVGVWISSGLMSAAICWMLQAWLSPRWGLLGGLLVAARLGMFGYWSQSYWGGALAAIGGTLVFGALRRIIRQPRVHDSILLGVGLAILANSRPFEGLLVSLPAAATLFVWMIGNNGPAAKVSNRKIVLPIFAVLVLTGAAMGTYNKQVTGNMFQMPYQVYQKTYAIAPVLVWQTARIEPTYHHKVMRDFHRWELDQYRRLQSMSELLKSARTRLMKLWYFYLGPLLTVPLLLLPCMWSDRWMRLVLLTSGLLMIVLLLVETWVLPHYAAPMTGLVYVSVLQGMRHLRAWRWRGKPAARFMVRVIPACIFASLVLTFMLELNWTLQRQPNPRSRILTQLKETGDRHLVIVRYSPTHSVHEEWVYNEADIDGADVVWAREMDKARTRELIAYFSDRKVSLLETDMN